MTTRDEKISALLDDALEQKELDAFMQDLKRDHVEDAERVQRYQMIGDVMKDDLNAASFMDISSAVHRAIEQEPELNGAAKPKAKIIDLSSWLRPLTGMAVAASVAMVTVVAFKTVQTESIENPVQTIADAQVETNKQFIGAQDRIVPVNPVIASQVRVASTSDVKNNRQLQAKQLSEYLMNHSGYAGQTTMQGMMPYIRVVSFDDGEKK